MKLTKKVLSIIIAAALLIGTVAVAVSAETLNVYEGSVLTYDITSDKDVSQGQAEVKPGETITVTVALTTNYYPGNAGGEVIYWTKGVFDDDATVATLGTADDYWGGMTNFPLTNTAAYPSDVSPDVYTGFLRTRTGSTDHIAAGTQMSAFDKEVFYTFVFTVPEDATIGSTVDFVMPASKICGPTQTATRTYTIRQNIGASATYAATKVADYAETVIVNDLTVTVVDDEPVTEEPTTQEPVTEEPTTQEPEVSDYDGLTYEGSKLIYTISSDKTDENGVTNVKIGETINIQVYMQTNYYIGSAGGEFFLWTSGIFNTLANTDVTPSGVINKYNCTVNNPAVSGMFPSTHGTSEWTGYLSSRNALAGTVPEIVSEPQLIYTIALTVPDDDALVGKTAKFEMPSGSIKCPTLTSRKGTIYQTIATSTTNAADSASYSESVDLTGASLTINIVSDVETEYCDYSALETAYALTPAYAQEYYDEALWAEWSEESAAAKTILDAEKLVLTDANQLLINNAAKALTNAYDALVPAFVDVSDLEAAIAECDAPEYGEELYDAALWTAWEAALAAAQAGVTEYDGKADTAANQAAVAALATDLRDAYAALVPAVVDLTDLKAAIAESTTPAYAAEYYNADAYAAWEAALAAAQAGVKEYEGKVDTADNQAAVAALAKDVRDTFAALVPAFVDLADLEAAIAESTTPAYAAEYYDADAYAAWEAALAAAQAGVTEYDGKADTAANQAAVAALAKDVCDTFAALVPSIVDLTDLKAAIAESTTPAYAAEYYNADAYAAWEAALAAAQAGVTEYDGKADTAANQAAVAALAKDVRDTFAALVPAFVDISDLEAAIAESTTPAYAAEYYNADAYAAWEAALAAAQAGVAEYDGKANTADNQAAVAALAKDVRDTFAALVPAFVSYEKLEQAIADYSAPEYPAVVYTAASWTDYENALAAANEKNDNRPDPLPAATAENQEAIDAYATALEKAYKALELAESSIIRITALQSNYVVGSIVNHEVYISGNGHKKVQVLTSNGKTMTYDRTNANVKSITVDEEGNETWVIGIKIYAEEFTSFARVRTAAGWELGYRAFDCKCLGEDLDVRSAEVLLDGEVVTSFLTKDVVTVKIVTGADVTKIQLKNPVTGSTATYSTVSAVNEDGSKVWTITRSYTTAKDYDFDIIVKTAKKGWVDSDVNLQFTATKTPVPQVPSTGDVEDAVFSASVGAKRMLRGSTQSFEIVTDIDAKAVRILNAAGDVVAKITTSASSDETTKTWTLDRVYNSIGDYEYTVEALYGSTWLADADGTLAFTVIY